MLNQDSIKQLVATVQKLAGMDPQDEAVARVIKNLQDQASVLSKDIEHPAGFKGSFGEQSLKDDLEFIKCQVDKLHTAALRPYNNYRRISAICAELKRVVGIAERPQYAGLKPKIAAIVEKVAGVFSEIDTVQDLDKPLEAIEKAVHGLYGDQSKNSTFYFERRGKGHHSESK